MKSFIEVISNFSIKLNKYIVLSLFQLFILFKTKKTDSSQKKSSYSFKFEIFSLFINKLITFFQYWEISFSQKIFKIFISSKEFILKYSTKKYITSASFV